MSDRDRARQQLLNLALFVFCFAVVAGFFYLAIWAMGWWPLLPIPVEPL